MFLRRGIMLKKLKDFIKKHDKLYIITKSIKSINDPNLVKVIRGYYDYNHPEVCTLLLEHNGEYMPDRIVYDISCGEKVKSVGFCAEMHQLLYRLRFAEAINAVPRVHWGEYMFYYDHGMDYITKNAFEYYFEPVSEAADHSPNEFKNYIRSDKKHIYIYQNMVDKSYKINDVNFKLLAGMYRKYIHLNEKTSLFINSEIDNLLNYNKQIPPRGKILGIHVRGTDFNLGLLNHPNVVAPNEYLAKAKEIFSDGKYDKIFIATEDSTVLEMFVSEFGDKILYYKDVFRTSGKSGPHSTPNDRELNNYKLGLEVLRDVYTLANCDGFLSGLSHVAFAARYVNIALDRKFDAVYTIDKGINYDKR